MRGLRNFLFFVFSMVSILSCDNSDSIGDLLGQWKLEEVTYKGSTTQPDSLYLCFQSQYVYTLTSGGEQAFGHYVHSGNVMTMKFYYSNKESNVYATDPNNPQGTLARYMFFDNGTPRSEEDIARGIYPVNLSFKIETYTSSTLILTNDNGRWVFTKW